MEVDLQGMIRTAPARGPALLPVFEAIMNSIHAAGERGVDAEIKVVLHRSGAVVDDPEGPLAPITSVTIVDNGAGFNDANYRSFELLYSPYKAAKGGKGLGRVRFLERFQKVVVTSRYNEGKRWYQRTFEFQPRKPEVVGPDPVQSSTPGWETSVKLVELKSNYAAEFPKRTDTVARKIVEHFFVKYLADHPPRILVVDDPSGDSVDTRDLFREEYEEDLQHREIRFNGWSFQYKGVWIGKEAGQAHEAVFCAHDRAVMSERLTAKEPLLASIVGPHGHPTYRAYVSGPLLDDQVDHARTSFNFDRAATAMSFNPDLPKWDDIVDLVVAEARSVLGEYLSNTRQRNVAANRDFISGQHPEFQSLLKYKADDVAKIPHNSNVERRYADLQRIRTEWRIELDQKVSKAMATGDAPAFRALIGELTDSTAADLVQYVGHRRWVIDLLEKCLWKDEDGHYPPEAAPHDILWPRKTATNDDVWYDPGAASNLRRHNLWLLDERLAFHHYLASDIEFGSLPEGLSIDQDRERADILIYDTPSAFVEASNDEISAVTIVELKRPERPGPDNPIQQALDYAAKIKFKGAQDPASGRRYRVSTNARFYCYVCATVNDRIHYYAKSAGLTLSPDGSGYFGYMAGFNAYVEVLDWETVLRDAKKRNRAWFDIAGLR